MINNQAGLHACIGCKHLLQEVEWLSKQHLIKTTYIQVSYFN